MAMVSVTQSGSRTSSSPIPHMRIDEDVMFEDRYEFKNRLGQGTFGVVYEVLRKADSYRAACKIVMKEKAGHTHMTLLEREVSILKKVQHPHIIQLIEVCETPKKMMLVMELCSGELSKFVKKKKRLAEADVKTVMSRLCDALSYLHKIDIMHRDLKLENVLMANNPNDPEDNLYVKVTDFGLSVVKGGVGQENMKMDKCGTLAYMAPEIIDSKCYSEKCDVWALGVIMFYLISGSLPFQGNSESKLHEAIKEAGVESLFEKDVIWKTISDDAKNLLLRMLNKDPAHRVTAREAFGHEWLTGSGKAMQKNVLELMREFNVEQQQRKYRDDAASVEANIEEEATLNKSICTSAPTQARDSETMLATTKRSVRPASGSAVNSTTTPTKDRGYATASNNPHHSYGKLLEVPMPRTSRRRKSAENMNGLPDSLEFNRSASSTCLINYERRNLKPEADNKERILTDTTTKIRPRANISNHPLSSASNNSSNKHIRNLSKSKEQLKRK